MLLRSQPKLSQSQPPKKPMNESKLPGNPPPTRHWTLWILVKRRYSNLSFLGLGDTCGPCFSTASRRLNPWFAGSPRWRYVFFVKTLAPFCSPQKAGRGWKWCWYPMHSPCYNIWVFDPSHIYMKPLKFSTHQGDPHSTENLSIHPMNLEVLLLGAKHSKETTTNGCALTSLIENQRKLVSLTCYVVRSHLRTTWCTLAPACVSKGNLMLSCASFFTTSWRIRNWLRTITGKFIWKSGTWLPAILMAYHGLSSCSKSKLPFRGHTHFMTKPHTQIVAWWCQREGALWGLLQLRIRLEMLPKGPK